MTVSSGLATARVRSAWLAVIGLVCFGTLVVQPRPAAAARPLPTITGISPRSGPTVGGTEVTITGTGFTGLGKATAVRFGDAPIPYEQYGWSLFTVVSDSRIVVTAPPHAAGSIHVTVTISRNTADPLKATAEGTSLATAADVFTFVAPAGGRWSRAAACPASCGAAAAALHDGRILTAGATAVTWTVDQGLAAPRRAQIYDPARNTWSATGSLVEPRLDPVLVVLRNGRVLAVGGTDRPVADLYDPDRGTWRVTGAMVGGSRFCSFTLFGGGSACSGTLLHDGKVLVVGGSDIERAEVYDPATDAWSPTGHLSRLPLHHTATLLDDGRVLVAGGLDLDSDVAGTSRVEGASMAAELYDPTTNRWSETGRLSVPVWYHTATLLRDGRVLVAGGARRGVAPEPFSQIYDPRTGAWSATGPLEVPRMYHTATLLPDGRVLVVGGVPAKVGVATGAVEAYDPRTGRWTLVASPPAARAEHTAMLLERGCGSRCGEVLLVGGLSGTGFDIVPQPAAQGNDRATPRAALTALDLYEPEEPGGSRPAAPVLPVVLAGAGALALLGTCLAGLRRRRRVSRAQAAVEEGAVLTAPPRR